MPDPYLFFKNDREAIEVAVKSIGLIPCEKLKIIRVKNTKHLGEVDVSQAYEHELSDRDDLEIISEARPMAFDDQGCLESF